jgi:ABC-2 type transport system ATP-binding protein
MPAAPTPSAADAAVLRCAGLRKTYGERLAVVDVGFHIDAGETYGLLGPNGAGKTTSISMICGLLRRDAGEVFVAGLPVDIGTTTAKGAIGYVPQDLAIYPDLTARENLKFFGRLQRMGGKALDARVDEVLEVIGLADRAKDRTEGFSGGMKRRLNIGIGLLHRPRLLVLDEPTVGVDPQSRNAILTSIAELEREGMAILYTTHYMEEAERLCNRIGIIDAGHIQAEGTRRELVDLVGEKDRVELSASGSLEAAAEALRRLDGRIEEVTVSDGTLDIIVTGARTILPAMLEAVAGAGAAVRSVTVIEPDLEAVFLHLTGKALRD